MEALIIEPTEFSPRVLLDAKKNKFEISGESRTENAGKFYQPILDWFDNYYSLRSWNDSSFDSKPAEVIFEFKFEYFNSTSAKYILDILKKVEKFRREKMDIEVRWYYNRNDMLEAGEELSNIIGFPFEYVAIQK